MHLIYLAQTDTTAGLLSLDLKRLNLVKSRPANKPCLKAVASLSVLKQTLRPPKAFRNLIRRSKRTSFIYPNSQALRVVFEPAHAEFLRSLGGWAYSTSANQHTKEFDLAWAKSVADVIVGDSFTSQKPSAIFRLGKKRIRRVR